ncbi:uncharacterized protein N7484_010723, partial [Penicillium longicatenatum]|uniref:uncharacterized protein n=1 Tax=Penicillium longicatenatum TaxID=1561947 RepID=UPI002547397B
MDPQSQARRRKAVKHLYRKFGLSQPWYYSSGDLQSLGIQALQIDVTGDGTLKFDPCFFRPYPEKALQVYPPDFVQMADISPPQTLTSLTSRPEVTSMIQIEEETGVKNEAARATYNSAKKLLGPDEWHDHARETYSFIQSHLNCARIGLTGSLAYSQNLRGFLPNPHAIFILTSDVPASNAKNCLTLHKMQAILGIMVIRTTHRPFRSHPLHPLLVRSHTGEKHGRIIQASLHGEHFILQSSPLWSFADDNKAPVELSIRYQISQLVELARWEKPNPAIDSL